MSLPVLLRSRVGVFCSVFFFFFFFFSSLALHIRVSGFLLLLLLLFLLFGLRFQRSERIQKVRSVFVCVCACLFAPVSGKRKAITFQQQPGAQKDNKSRNQ